VLVVGGQSFGAFRASAELFDPGFGFTNSWRPQIASFGAPLKLGDSFVAFGSQFRGVAEGSGGNGAQDSPADYPLVQLRSIESGQTTFLLSTNWSANSFTSVPLWNFPPGYAFATVFVNGIPSTSSIANVSVPVPVAVNLSSAAKLGDGSFRFSFTNSSGAMFSVLASTNLNLPLSNWTILGGATEISAGQFQFTNPQATNSGQRFYRIRSQ
jgi:hypothetical protein